MSDTVDWAFYPRYCFHLAPTANAWCFFPILDLFRLEQRDGFEGEGLFFYRNLPVKWVRIVGVVVAIDEFAGLRAFTIDDSSGACIEAFVSLAPTKTTSGANEPTLAPAGPLAQPASPYDHVDVGSVMDVKGALTTFRDTRQLKVEKMTAVRGTADEIRLWAKRRAFRRDVLARAWVLPDKTIRKCCRDAERSEAEAERKSQRLKAAASGSRRKMKTDKGGDAARGRRGVAEGHGEAQLTSGDGEEALKALAASCKGNYSALGF